MEKPNVSGASVMAPPRYPVVDAVRGLAIVMMVAYHVSFDLNHFGYARIDFHADFWLNFRAVIVWSFLLVMGVSLHLATRNGIRWPRFLQRAGQIALYALIVSIGSYLIFPQSWIYFGVLHFVFAASFLGLLFRNLFWGNLLLGIAIWLWDSHYGFDFFNAPAWNWTGLNYDLPANTEDYVPIIPWLGTVLIGMFIGRLLFDRNPLPWLAVDSGHPFLQPLALAGRHSLNLYLLHQPLLFALFWLWLHI